MHVTNLYVTNQPGAVESRRRREPGPNLIDLDSGVGALAPGGPARADVEDEVLGDLPLVDDLADPDPDLVGVLQPPGVHRFS